MIFNFDTTYAQLPKAFFSQVNPTPVSNPKLVLLNSHLASELGLDLSALSSELGLQTLCGNIITPGTQPLAQAYCGHQFGHFAGLGDGRAHLLGEHLTPNKQRFDIQLKGSGPTTYSRRGDGRAALGPMLREYIISEAMYALGVPTTRSLAVVATGEPVYRESVLPGAILTRVAQSHIRVGTFQYAATLQDTKKLESLALYTMKRHYPKTLLEQPNYLLFLEQVQQRQARLISKWLLLGFIHGVMNTDNMSICGETIDYGPCAFLDDYKPNKVFSSIDRQGRYAYANQGVIGQWNLTRFAETLLPLIDSDSEKAIEMVTPVLNIFQDELSKNWLQGMRSKLGLKLALQEDETLSADWLKLLQKHNQDYTNSFWSLSQEHDRDPEFFSREDVKQWIDRWQQRQNKEPLNAKQRTELMLQHNPFVIPRNHQVEKVLREATENGDLSFTQKLLEALAQPFGNNPRFKDYQQPPRPGEEVQQTFCGT